MIPRIYALALSLFAGLLAIAIAIPANAQSTGTIEVNLPAQTLESALRQLISHEGVQVLFAPEDVKGVTTPEVKGRYTPEQVIQKLTEGTGLAYSSNGKNVFAIKPKSEDRKAGVRGGASNSGPTILAQGEVAAEQQERREGVAKESVTKDSVTKVESITVTGTNIRGSRNLASPLQVYTREDIDRSGVGSVQKFIETLPQNFGNWSENTMAGVSGNPNNFTLGSAVNLRGLGASSTLVLINGRRVAPGSRSGEFVDVSLIPLSALERIEVLTDGASAIYGSDAVGGVVNFILRRDFEGGETRARYGTVTKGDSHEYQVGQTFGHNWDRGSALFSYEYFDRTVLDVKDRSYTQNAPSPFALIPAIKRQGAFITVEETPWSGLEVFLDGSFGQRKGQSDDAFGTTRNHQDFDVHTYAATAGTRIEAFKSSNLELSGTHAVSDTDSVYRQNGTVLLSSSVTKAKVSSFDANLNGPITSTYAGSILYAVGAQFRKEDIDSNNRANPLGSYRNRRDVSAEFVEVRVPLLGKSSSVARDVELTLADRNERYSDFGSTNNPKVGLSWQPDAGITFRSTYGTSFRAPLLTDLNPTPRAILVSQVFDPVLSRNAPIMFIFGSNPDLQPEKAKTFTLGLDLRPRGIPGMKGYATYYNVRYDNRIVTPPGPGINTADLLRLEAILGPTVAVRNPSLARLQQIAASVGSASFFNFANIPLTDIHVIGDLRQQNLASVRTDGIDFGVSYQVKSALGNVETGVDGTKVLKFANRFTESSPSLNVLDTVFNPVNLKLRARAIFQHSQWTWALFANYVDSYRDNRPSSVGPVNSWTTFDVAVTYKTGKGSGLLDDLSVTLGIVNVADRDPPYVANPSYPVNFDGTNANALGRFVSLQASKSF